jgi:molybdopterin converting factor small subunit
VNVTVYYHAFLREKLGRESELLVVLDENATAGSVVSAFVAGHPEFARLASAMNIAVNDEIVGRDAAIQAADRMDLLPPYGGG